VIVGHGPQGAAARQLVAELGIAERVSFLPWLRQDELSPLYDEASVLLYPSVEAQGLVVAEALAHGVPPVTISGTGPSVLAGHVGWEVTGSDLVEELADALSDAHSEWLEGVLADRRVEARRQYERALDWTRIVDDLESVYAGVCREVARAA
jgi:D-inositol-3-phosphate glycosyltransferase